MSASNFKITLNKIFKSLRVFAFLLLCFFLVLFILALLSPEIFSPEKHMYFEKDPIQLRLNNTIKNGGDLRIVKHIYDNRNVKSGSGLSAKPEDNYIKDYPLSGILNDLLEEYYQNTEPKDSAYLSALMSLIAENEKKNPFDNLEDNQKYYFQIIQEKLDTTDYQNISQELSKITQDLNNKNQLVTKYLNKSESSYRISLLGLLLSLILGFSQLWQSYGPSKRKQNQEN